MLKRIRLAVLGFVAPALLSALTPNTALGQTWNLNAAGNYGTAANWTGTVVPDSGATATFGSIISASRIVTLDISPTLGGITFNHQASPGVYTISTTTGQVFNLNANSSIVNDGLGATISTGIALAGITNVTGSGPSTLTLSGQITGASGQLVVNLTPAFVETAQLVLSNATNSFGGGLKLQSGNLTIGATGAIGGGTGTLEIAGANTGILANATGFIVANPVSLNGGPLQVLGTNGLTFSNVISNASGDANGVTVLIRTAASNAVFTAANTYTGPTLIRPSFNVTTGISNTIMAYSGAAGSALNSSSFTATSAQINLDNTGVAFIPRIGNIASVNLNTGIFSLTGGTDATDVTQNAGTLTMNGGSIVRVNLGTGGGATTMNFDSLVRGTRATGLVTGSTTGFGAGAASPNLKFNTAPIVATGLGTTSADIIPWLMGDTSGTGNGTNFVTYDSNGVRLLTASETTGTLTAGQNVRLITPAVNNSTIALKSLALVSAASGGADITGTGTLQMSGPIMSVGTATGTTTVQNSISQNIDFGATEGILHIATMNASTGTTFLAVFGNIAGSGGLTISGSGSGGTSVAFLSPNNTYTGITTLNRSAVQFQDASALGRSTTPIVSNNVMGFGFGSIQFPTVGATDLNGRGIEANDGHLTLAPSAAGGVMMVTGQVTGTGALTTGGFTTAGAVVGGRIIVTGNNTNSYVTRIASTNFLEIGADSNLGTANQISFSPTANFGLLLQGNVTTSKQLLINAATRINTNGFNMDVSGAMTGNSAVNKFGAGDLKFRALNGFSGGLNISSGSVTLADNGRFDNYTTTAIAGGKLVLDNTGTAISNRLSIGGTVTSTVTAASSAGLSILTGAGNVVESPATLAISGGGSHMAIRMTASGAGTILLSPGALGESNSRAILVAGTGLANTAAATGPGQTGVRFTTPPTLAGGAGASGTQTVSIIPGGYGDTNPNGHGEGFITHVPNVGVRLLDASEYVNNAFTPSTANARINTASIAPAASTVNALFMDNANVTITSDLAVTSGTILATGTGPLSLAGTGTAGGGATLTNSTTTANQIRGLIFNAVTDVNSNVVFNSGTSSAGWRFVKLGPGTLDLNPRTATGAFTAGFTGTNITDTRIYGGTVAITASGTDISAVGSANIFITNDARFRYTSASSQTGRTITIPGGSGRLDFTGQTQQLTATGAALAGIGGRLILEGGTLVLGSGTSGTPSPVQANTISGGIQINSGATLAINAADAAITTLVLGDPTNVVYLNGGSIGPRFASRTVFNHVEVNASSSFSNNLSPTFLVAGNLPDTSNSSLTFNAPVRLNASATLTNNLGGTSATSVTFSGGLYDNPFAAASTLTIANSGASVTRINGPSVHRGGTTVASGSLVVGNSVGSATGRGNVVVNAGARLAGGNAGGTTGFVYPATGGSITVNGILEAGNGIAAVGLLTLGSPVTDTTVSLGGVGSRYNFNLAATNAGSLTDIFDGSSTTTIGTGNNFLRVQGFSGSTSLSFLPETLAITSTAGLTNWDATRSYSWRLGTVTTGTLTSASPFPPAIVDTTNFNNTIVGGFYMFQAGNDLFLNYTPVPEPATILGLSAGAFAIGGLVRRRFRKSA
ncbi:MAG: PEP-CTERM sorting domain-containing protein [Gemmataceae bacterium]|nr:PEP-CTERM sorting domain-containing protein [Gemmataceae bacterium]